MLPPGKTIGVLGGGQLGRMFSHAASRLGYRVHIFEPSGRCPAGEVSAVEVNAPYTDVARLRDFVAACDVVTYEFENIPVAPLWEIEKSVQLHPHWNVLEVCQNRMREKSWLRKNGFPHVPFAEVEAGADLAAAIKAIGLPCVVKTADFGYDGKGQLKVTDEAGIQKATTSFSRQRAVVEKFIDFKCELSVIVARSSRGEARTFPVAENIHTRHILDFSIVPARVPDATRRQAADLGIAIAEKIGLVGLLAVELFLTDRGELLVNELAPRPHNSGHTTLDACRTSQFEQHVRAICGLPLGDVTTTPSVMVNILGDSWKWDGERCVGDPAWAALHAAPDAKLHLYGKSEPRPGRKMGHFTVLGATPDAALERARTLKAELNAGVT
ncbi:5-(carboxyamino)imidazole ribonucleotide synthase [Nibricoccus sp. IMCC34717]|uniref:5-(carboxyamino)imidazole ribonucleotide synthase n=1 Tax=Nibricoccus sp. IMCC34717 TaxID=3034021 RepID=UPI00384DBE2D